MDTILETIQSNWSKIKPGEQKFLDFNLDVNHPWSIRQMVGPGQGKNHILAICYDMQISDTLNFPKFKMFDVVINQEEEDKTYILLELKNTDFFDEFDNLLTHIIRSLQITKSINESLKTLRDILYKWKELLAESKRKRSDEIGLFGELWFIENVLCKYIGFENSISSWTSKSSSQDFETNSHVFEIKTTTANNPNSISISNESQLHATTEIPLILVFLKFDRKLGQTFTLKQLVDSCRKKCNSTSSLVDFDNKLIEYGYSFFKSEQYNDYSYHDGNKTFFQVTDEFPKITPDDLSPGIGNVRYQINLLDIMKFEIKENVLKEYYD